MIMECGLGRYMGLPDHPDIAKLKTVWILGSQGKAISVLSLFQNPPLHFPI